MDVGNRSFSLFGNATQNFSGRSNNIPEIRRKVIELHAKNGLIKGLTTNFAKLVISDGLTLILNSEDKELAKDLRKKWNKHTNNATVQDDTLDMFVTSLIAEIVKAGDVLVYASQKIDRKNKTVVKLNTVVADRIKTPSKKQAKAIFDIRLESFIDISGFYIQDGIVISKGEHLGYCVSPAGENDNWKFFPKYYYNGEFSSVLIKNPIADILDVHRGIPLLAPGLQTVDDFAELRNSEIAAAMLRTKMMMILKVNEEIMSKLDPVKDSAKIAELKTQIQTFLRDISSNNTNGYIQPNDTTVEIRDPKNNVNPELEKALMPFLREIASLYGVPYPALALDTRDETGLTARVAYIMAWSFTEIWRQSIYNKLLIPYFELWLSNAGYDYEQFDISFTSQQYGFAKTVEEFNANKVAVEAGFKSVPQAIADMGGNYHDVLASQEEYLKDLGKLLPINTENKGI